MSALILIVHILVCLILIIAILLQSGKSADLAGAFGGMGSQTVFGPRGAATILSKATTICAILFMITSMGLWILSAKGERSVVSGEQAPVEQKAAVPETEKKQGEEKKAPEETTQQQTDESKKQEVNKQEEKKQENPVKKQGTETEKKTSEPIKN
jgi:preprotein translocase subunit SecG